MMLRLLLVGFCALFAAGLALAVVGGRQVLKLLKMRKHSRLMRLRSFQGRLQPVINTLLIQVNELDQEVKYLDRPMALSWSTRMARICEDLVALADNLNVIEKALRDEDLKEGQEALLGSCRLCVSVRQQFRDLRLMVANMQIASKAQ